MSFVPYTGETPHWTRVSPNSNQGGSGAYDPISLISQQAVVERAKSQIRDRLNGSKPRRRRQSKPRVARKRTAPANRRRKRKTTTKNKPKSKPKTKTPAKKRGRPAKKSPPRKRGRPAKRKR